MNSLQDLLTENRIPFAPGGEHRHVREGWIGIDCPFPTCGGVEKWHLGINLESLACSCWRCGRKSIGEVLAELFRIPIPQAWGLVKGLSRGPRIASKKRERKGVLAVPNRLEAFSGGHWSYLRGRGFDPEKLEQIWGLRALGMVSRLSWRIFIPVHLDGEIVTWTTRTIGKTKGLKYINADPDEEVYPIKTLLYGWDYVRSFVIVCEGPTDVWRIGPGAVCTFGLNVSDSQMQLLSQIPRRIVCFDNEDLAQRRAEKLCNELSVYPGETLNVRLDSPDPGCANRGEVEMLRNFLK